MIHFRTILLWLAFVLLFLQYFIDIQSNITLGIIFRLAPSGILLLWFLLSVFFRVSLHMNAKKTPSNVIKAMNILRPLASISIVLGAIFKILHWPNGNELLLVGICIMAIYSTLLSRFAYDKPESNPDILDDHEL